MTEMTSLLRAIVDGIQKSGSPAISSEANDRPHILVLHKGVGLVAAHVQDPWNDETTEATQQQLNVRLRELRFSVPRELHPFIRALIIPRDVFPDEVRTSPETLVSVNSSWIDSLELRDFPDFAYKQLEELLFPQLFFSTRFREFDEDVEQGERRAFRYSLDNAQTAVAMRRIKDVLCLTGPAGCGKTLVLAARARWLAEEHPEWRIQIMCFNHALVPYLKSLVGEFPNIQVEQFGEFTRRVGHRFSMGSVDDSTSLREFANAQAAGIDYLYDALMIDESQDFSSGWIKFSLAGLFPHRGAALIVGDPNQALYRDLNQERAFSGHHVDFEYLGKPYRSTRQILEAIQTLDPALSVDGARTAPNGPPVDLIWASSISDVGDAMAFEIKSLMGNGVPAGQIGVLVVAKYQLSPLAGQIGRAGVRIQPIWDAKKTPLAVDQDSVKILTANASKGLDFEAVLIAGLEQIKDPEDESIDHDEQIQRMRFEKLNLVGPSRAKDRCMIFYSKSNKYIDRLRADDSEANIWTYPDDYQLEA